MIALMVLGHFSKTIWPSSDDRDYSHDSWVFK